VVDSKNTLSNKLAVYALIFAVIACSVLVYFVPIKDLLKQSLLIKSWLATTGYAAPAIFALATIALTALGMPRLIFCTLGGMVFGFSSGFLLSHFGSLFGAYAIFIFARWSGRDYVQHKFPKIIALSNSSHANGWRSVLFMRQLPISGLYNDILLGLSKISHADFWIGSFIGFLPLGVTASLIGAGAIKANLSEIGMYIALATCAFFMLTLSLKWLLTQIQRKNPSPG
jgi:uncharacterized membrane protein YdjX (TVP38/TMEM64 family)